MALIALYSWIPKFATHTHTRQKPQKKTKRQRTERTIRLGSILNLSTVLDPVFMFVGSAKDERTT